MNSQKIHVYFVPGLAAGKEIFRNIKLPEDTFQIHILEWLLPENKEKMSSYAQRMAAKIHHKNPVLIGVSFGGVVAQEMSKFLKCDKLIIISSVKKRTELPKRLRIASKTGLYKLVPTRLVLSTDDLTKYAVGPRSKKRLGLYNDYLHVRDKDYLDWAIKNMVCWKRREVLPGISHIHGDSDIVFPLKNIEDCAIIKGGTHVMILNKGKEVSEKIVDIIQEK
ncbi:alpha/beta fold hydrolase [Jejudonia soesokkakensis]|uniref:Alpha/beta fold hydrolase n=1 Tax=Jejudonia soesokkakensis TaxID=1323432 RepID=A0ABW2MXB6_9FLAO